MKLSANLVKSYNSVNSFNFGDWSIRANEPNTLYFQLVDLDQQVGPQASSHSLRYLAGIGVSNQPVVVKVTFPTLDSADTLEITASLVDSADASLFKVELTDEQVPNSGNVIFSVQEGTVTRKFFILNGISVEDLSSLGQC